jgi:hypothetical protein
MTSIGFVSFILYEIDQITHSYYQQNMLQDNKTNIKRRFRTATKMIFNYICNVISF